MLHCCIRITLLLIALCLSQLSFSQKIQHDTICAGTKNARYKVDNHPGSTYYWSVTGGEIISGNGSSSITVNWDHHAGLGLLDVVERNPGGCYGERISAYVFRKGIAYTTNCPSAACRFDSVQLEVKGGGWYLWGNGMTGSKMNIKLLHDTVISVIVSDSLCGVLSDTVLLPVKAIDKPIAGFRSSSEQIHLNENVEFSYTGDGTDKVHWKIRKSNIRESNAHQFETAFLDTGKAGIQIISINKYGCSDTLFREFEITDEGLIFPTAFSPNGDGLNDVFEIHSRNLISFSFKVFDRWGQVLYHGIDPEEKWDGRSRGVPVMDGVYLYHCEAKGRSGKIIAKSGSLAIIR